MDSSKEQYTIFSDISPRQNEILNSDYVYKTLYAVKYSRRLRPNLTFDTNVSQKVSPSKNFSIANRANIAFLYKSNVVEVYKNFETNGNMKINFLYYFQKFFSGNGYLYSKFLSNHSESRILPQIGVKLRSTHLKAEGKYDFDKKLFSNKLLVSLTRGVIPKDSEEFGGAFAFSSDLKYLFRKCSLFYKSDDFDASLTFQNPKKVYLLIYNKARENLDIALKWRYDGLSDKNFKIVLGGSTNVSPNVLCKAKIDDNFNVATSFLLKVSHNVSFVLSSHFSLNPNPKKESLPHLPFGFQLMISDN